MIPGGWKAAPLGAAHLVKPGLWRSHEWQHPGPDSSPGSPLRDGPVWIVATQGPSAITGSWHLLVPSCGPEGAQITTGLGASVHRLQRITCALGVVRSTEHVRGPGALGPLHWLCAHSWLSLGGDHPSTAHVGSRRGGSYSTETSVKQRVPRCRGAGTQRRHIWGSQCGWGWPRALER